MDNCINGNARRPQRRLPSIPNYEATNGTNGPKQKIVIALYSYEGRGEGELRFEKGDKLVIIDDTDGKWWLAKGLTSETTGYIPMNFVINETTEWFFSETSRSEAETLLLSGDNPRGTFLIRYSEQHTGNFSLSVLEFDSRKLHYVIHYKIVVKSSKYFITSWQSFAKLEDLVAHYSNYLDGLCCPLYKPCPKPSQTGPPKCPQEIARNDLNLLYELGSGSFGKVYYGLFRDEVEVAIKMLKPGTMSPKAFLQEAAIMRKYRHKHLVSLYGVCSMDQPLLIVTEYMCNGSLLDYFTSPEGKSCTVNDLIDMSAQILSGMAYLEAIKVVHRDLAARNILVGENKEVKVADFGLARIIDEDEYMARIGAKFPIKWTAPEAANKGRFTSKSDIWSFGILLYELMTKGGTPYPDLDIKHVLQQVDRGYRMPYPAHSECPNSIYQIMLDCWHKDPDKRPTFQDLYSYFNKVFY